MEENLALSYAQSAVSSPLSLVKNFDPVADFWQSMYRDPTLYGHIHQQRLEAALGWIDELALQLPRQVLEVGCDAGLTVELARRGLRVQTIDVSSRMLHETSDGVRRAGLSSLVSLCMGDAQALSFETGCFSLVIALGVIPWLPSPELAVREMVRVLKPGGHLLLNCDNRWRLNHLLDPFYFSCCSSLRSRRVALLRHLGVLAPCSNASRRRHSKRQFDRMLTANGMEKKRSMMLGFGPFSCFGKQVFSEPMGIKIHRRLQHLANRNMPVIRFTAAQYMVLAWKKECGSH